ncbi:MAG: hypothetical protein SGARI_007471, partial [Bacillariaceae sp.]
MKVSFTLWFLSVTAAGPLYSSAFVPNKSFVAQQASQELRSTPQQDDTSYASYGAFSDMSAPQPQQQSSEPIDTFAVSSQDEKLGQQFPSAPQPEVPQPPPEQASQMTTAAQAQAAQVTAAAAATPHSRRVVFASDGGMMFQEMLPKALTKPKRLVPYASGAFKQDQGMMYEEQKGSVPVASVTPDRPVAYAAGAFQPDQGMMFEARTAGGTPSYYDAAPVPQTKPNPSVFSSDGGMMFAARTAP